MNVPPALGRSTWVWNRFRSCLPLPLGTMRPLTRISRIWPETGDWWLFWREKLK